MCARVPVFRTRGEGSGAGGCARACQCSARVVRGVIPVALVGTDSLVCLNRHDWWFLITAMF